MKSNISAVAPIGQYSIYDKFIRRRRRTRCNVTVGDSGKQIRKANQESVSGKHIRKGYQERHIRNAENNIMETTGERL